MATIRSDGIEKSIARMDRMARRDMVRKIVMAGAAAAEKRMAEETRARGHVRTGDMLESIGTNEYREILGGGRVDVYPLGEDRNGTRNATKAYVINYGKGLQPYARKPKRSRRKNLTGDKFITGQEKQTEEAVRAAMQAEHDRLMDEIDK